MKKILVVDDSKFVRNFHISILQSAGFLADGAEDGAEAIEMAMRTDYALILSDINMQKMDGITFVKKVRAAGYQIPVIIISTQDTDLDRMQGYEAGANVYVTKPVKPNKLVENVKMLLGR